MDEEPAGLPAGVVHGSNSTYNNWGCRCDECRRAHTEYNRPRRPPSGPELARRRAAANRRRTLAFQWVRANRRDVWAEICVEVDRELGNPYW